MSRRYTQKLSHHFGADIDSSDPLQAKEIKDEKSCVLGPILGVSQIQRNQGKLELHSSTMGSPDLKVVPDCVEDVMLSFPCRPETNNNMKRNGRNIVLSPGEDAI